MFTLTPQGQPAVLSNRAKRATQAYGKLVNVVPPQRTTPKSVRLIVEEADGQRKSVLMPVDWGLDFDLIADGNTYINVAWDDSTTPGTFAIEHIDPTTGEIIDHSWDNDDTPLS